MSLPNPVQAPAPGMSVKLRQRVGALWQRLREGGALMVGVPDYARYVAHMQETHPELAPLSREAFVRARMEARYGGKGGGKCPC